MSYEVLARKWRPRTFEEMVGQEHVLRALINALDNDRLHHAFLFTGTRGVGKTTIARILAKSLNCEQGVSSTPCGECSACREIDEGRFIDLIEVDAASRTKVEDTRELLENVQYAPTRGRYKVYLVDEVHMLSNHSFNALLKTLEEPPPHVKFLLATTDPQKLPVTVLSRCLQFNLKRLSPEKIAGHLEKVLGAERIPFERGALRLLARAADGSMRDALSLLDQAIAHGGGALQESTVGEMLGTIDSGRVRALLRHLAADDGEALLQEAALLSEQGADFLAVLAELLSLLHRIAVLQTVGEAAADPEEGEALAGLARLLSPEDTQLFYQIALLGRRDLPLAPDPRSGFEMILLRMLAFRPAEAPAGGAADEAGRGAGHAGLGAGGGGAPPAPVRPEARGAAEVEAHGVEENPPPPAAGTTGGGEEWSEVVAALGLRGIARELAANSLLQGRDGDRIRLALEEKYAQICTDRAKKSLESALSRYYGEAVRLEIEVGSVEGETPARRRARQAEERHRDAVAAIEQDPTVGSLREVLGAEVRPDRVRPLDE